jgi:hypothetical protein
MESILILAKGLSTNELILLIVHICKIILDKNPGSDIFYTLVSRVKAGIENMEQLEREED